MRSRIEKATKQKPATRTKKLPETEVSNQPIARNSSGKIALGPWVGAFGTNESNTEDFAVLYIDRAGSTHLDLSTDQLPASEGSTEMVQRSPKGHRKGTVLNPLESVETQIVMNEKDRKQRSREMESMQQKAIVANWGRTSCGKQASKGKPFNRIGMIYQPKKSY
eukprot:g8601.t1